MAKSKSGRYVAGGTGPSGTFRFAGRYDTFKEASAAAKKFVAALPLAHGDVLDTKTGRTRRVRDVSDAQRKEMKRRAMGSKKLPKNWPAGRDQGPWREKSGGRWKHVGDAYVDTGKGKSIWMEVFGRRSSSGALLKHESKVLFRRTKSGKVIASVVIDPRNKTLLDIHESKLASKKEIHLALKKVLALVSMRMPKGAKRF